MGSTFDAALIEAGDPATGPERLRQLSERKRRHERAQLRQTIAANPNADEDLLLALGADYPKEVISNPRFQLLELSGEAWWENCEAVGILKLLAELGGRTPQQARVHLIKLLAEGLLGVGALDMNMEWHMSFSHEPASPAVV